MLTLQGETFFSVRLVVLEYLALPFLLAGAYGVLREADSSSRRLLDEGVKNYFRVLLPALMVAFAAVLLLFALFVPLSLVGGAAATDLAIGATIVVLIPVAVFLSLYDTAACFEGLGVFASLRRSVALVLAHIWEVVVFLFRRSICEPSKAADAATRRSGVHPMNWHSPSGEPLDGKIA